MKTSFTVLMLVVLASYSCAAFAALIGLLPSSAFLGSEVVFFVYSLAGLAFIALNDTGRRASLLHTT